MRNPFSRTRQPLNPEVTYPLLSHFDFLAESKEKTRQPLLVSKGLVGVGLTVAAISGLATMNARSGTHQAAEVAINAEQESQRIAAQISAFVGADLDEFAELEQQAIAARAADATSTDVKGLWAAVEGTIPAGITPTSFSVSPDEGRGQGERVAVIGAIAGSADRFYEWRDAVAASTDLALLPGDDGSKIDIDADAIRIELSIRVADGTYTAGGS